MAETDPSKMSDMELSDRLALCFERQGYALQHNMESLSDSIDNIIMEIEMETEKRMIAAERAYFEKNNIDPLAPITLGEIEPIPPRETDDE